MPKIPSLTPKKLLKIVQKAGFEIDHITGSHYILYHAKTHKRVTILFHCKNLPKGTTHSILKSSEIRIEDL